MKDEKHNQRAVEALYAQLHDDLLAFFRRRVESAERAEDLTQETFLKLLRRLESGGSVANAQAYLFRVARNLVIDHYRTRKDTVQPPELPDESQEEERNEETRKEIAGWMGRFISYLPAPYRETLLLSEMRELPYAQIAERLGVTVGTVKSRVHRGRELLRMRLISCCRFLHDASGRVVDYEPHHWNAENQEKRPQETGRSNCTNCD